MKAPGAPPSQAAGKCEYFLCEEKAFCVNTSISSALLTVFSCAFCVWLVTLTLKRNLFTIVTRRTS